jgi:uncharacterized protein (DUF1778 family)
MAAQRDEVAMPSRNAKPKVNTHAVNLRMRGDTRSLIDRAAKAHGKSRSEFMIDAARRAAEDALLDQVLVRVDPKTYDYFLEVLDQPPGGEGFERLMQTKEPWAP